jgi:manganese transport protein
MTSLAEAIDVRSAPAGWRRLFAFLGPALLVSVGYMDPGNWATDLEGGARFGYMLLWVLAASNLIALLLQSLAARLGIAGDTDLAQASRAHYSFPVAMTLWGLAEIAIIACDLAELIGSAVALKILFGIPLAWGAFITGIDVFFVLVLQRYGARRIEAVIAVLVLTIGACFAFELLLARPDWSGIASGFAPKLDTPSLYVAVGILGATVMPHNLYLHSALVRTRALGTTTAAKREALRYARVDTTVSLNLAFLVNAAILILAAAVFHGRGIVVSELTQAHELLAPLLGTGLAAVAFAVALLAAGQSSTITGTLAGQVVMEGFLGLRLKPALRRLLTRGLAIIPAVTVLAVRGDEGVLPLLILSQVVLSLQLPFAVVPLVRFAGSRRLLGELAAPVWIQSLAWVAVTVIVALNGWLVLQTISDWDAWAYVLTGACGALLVWLVVVPLQPRAAPAQVATSPDAVPA